MVSGRVVATTINSPVSRAVVIDDRIFEMPEMTLGLDLHDFEVGDRGLKLRVPIDEALVLVDQAFLIELDENL